MAGHAHVGENRDYQTVVIASQDMRDTERRMGIIDFSAGTRIHEFRNNGLRNNGASLRSWHLHIQI